METIYKKNPSSLLGYLMAFAMVLFSINLDAQCVSGIGANSESFEDTTILASQGPWTNWVYDNSSSTFPSGAGWIRDSYGTPSSSTGPVSGLDSTNYLYCETSSPVVGGEVANLHSNCIDLSNFNDPAFVFGYHMYGSSMGTLNIDVSVDSGATWNNEWTLSGDQGNDWRESAVSLSNYSGQIIQVRLSYTAGTSYTGDCAVDNLRFMESPTIGCMDTLACSMIL